MCSSEGLGVGSAMQDEGWCPCGLCQSRGVTPRDNMTITAPGLGAAFVADHEILQLRLNPVSPKAYPECCEL